MNGTPHQVGYARVSKSEQNLDVQIDALEKHGCDRIFVEKVSGARDDRPEFGKALDHLRPGDNLVVWKLDRAGRSRKHLFELVDDLTARGIGFTTLEGLSVDTSTPEGKLVFGVFAILAEFERDLLIERTKAGLTAARARGRVGGRKTKMTPEKIAAAKAMLAETNEDGSATYTIEAVAGALDVSRATVYRAIERDRSTPAATTASSTG